MTIRRFVVRAATMVAAAGALVAGQSGTAAAAPAQGLFLYGQTVAVVGQNSGCNGLIDFALDTDPARPGVVAVTLISRGFNGVGPAWDANPVCPVDLDIIWDAAYFGFGSVAGHQVKSVEFAPSPRPGESMRTEIVTGGGLHVLGITASYVSATYDEVRPQIGSGFGGYVLVP